MILSLLLHSQTEWDSQLHFYGFGLPKVLDLTSQNFSKPMLKWDVTHFPKFIMPLFDQNNLRVALAFDYPPATYISQTFLYWKAGKNHPD